MAYLYNIAALSMTGQSENTAREILDRMSHLRIKTTRIRVTDVTPAAKGGQSVVIAGTLVPPEEFRELREEELAKLIPKGSKQFLSELVEESGRERLKSLPPEEFKRLVSEWIRKRLPERKVAVKKLEWPRGNAEDLIKFFKSFVNEISLMESLSHPNIIKFLGFVEDVDKGNAWIVIPWEANGNVREFLQSGEWDIPERISLIQDTARGLEYLHTREPPICHGDLKSLNILVNSSYRAVITDFGSARARPCVTLNNQSEMPRLADLDDRMAAGHVTSPQVKLSASTLDLTLTGPKFSLRWTAPEVLDDGVQNLSSDMWSIGWICWEIITGKIPFEEFNREAAIISQTIKGKLPPIRKDTQLSHVLMLCGLMSHCWLSQPAKRINASTFQRKVHMLVSTFTKSSDNDVEKSLCKPSETPSVYIPGGQKIRSARLLLKLGRMCSLQDNWAKAESHYLSAIEVATEREDKATEANTPGSFSDIWSQQLELWGIEGLDKQVGVSSCMGDRLGPATLSADLGEIHPALSMPRELGKHFGNTSGALARIRKALDVAAALDGLGHTYRAQSRNQEAEKAFNAAREINSRIGNDVGTADVLLGLGHLYRVESRYQDAEKSFRAAYEIHSRIGNDLGTANALVSLGYTYLSQSRHQLAEKAFMQGHEIHLRIGNDLGVAAALNGLGKAYGAQCRNQEAEKALNEASEIHSLIGDDMGTADALIGLGEIYMGQSKNQEAEKVFSAAHEIYSRIGNGPGTANALLGLGNTYLAQSRHQEAERAFLAAQQISSCLGNNLLTAPALVRLESTSHAHSRNHEVGKASHDAANIRSSVGGNLGAGNTFRDPGMLFSDQCKYNEAESFYHQTLAYEKDNDYDSSARTLFSLSQLLHAQQIYREAEEAVTEALAIWTSIGYEQGQGVAFLQLARIFESQSKRNEEIDALIQAERAFAQVGDPIARAAILTLIGERKVEGGSYAEGDESCYLAQAIFLSLGSSRGEASVLRALGISYIRQERFAEAEERFAQSRAISTAILDEEAEAQALDGLTGVYLLQGRARDATVACMEASAIYTRIGQPMSEMCTTVWGRLQGMASI